MSQHDFFELPVGDQHRERIESEYTNDYRAGYEEGLEAGRAIAVQMVEDERKRWEAKRCETCNNCDENMWCTFFANGTTVWAGFGCNGYESKDNLKKG